LDEVEPVCFDGAKTDEKFIGDFLSGIFLHDQSKDFRFPFGQRPDTRIGFANIEDILSQE
jgi:hypothetical protein